MQWLEPIYSRDKSEAEVQADLYCAIKQLGLDPRLEVRGYLPEMGLRNGRRKCVFDIVVFWPLNHKPICIIECKRGVSVNSDSRQKAKYSKFELTLIYAFRNNQDQIVKQVRELAAKDWNNAPPSMKRAAEWQEYVNALDGGDCETVAIQT